LDVQQLEGSGLAGFNVDLPTPATSEEGYNLTLSGWALAPDGPPSLVRLSVVGPSARTIAESRLLGRRPRLAEHFADIPCADRSGFLFYSSLVGLPSELDLELSAQLADGRQVPLARLRVHRDVIPPRHSNGMEPLLLDVPGRSGSTWLTALLGQHPQCVTYRPFEREPRVAAYWMEVFRAVSGPTAYTRATRPDEVDTPDWWIADRDWLAHVDVTPDVHLHRWLVSDSVEEIAEFCRSRIDSFYRNVARDEAKEEPSFFAERVVNPRLTAMVREFFPRFAQIHLIRDPRDILVSRLALNARTGRQQFGRGAAEDDEEYVRKHFAREMSHFIWKLEQAGDRSVLVKYEDLIEQPEETLRRIFIHLRVAAEPGTVSQVLEDARRLAPERQEFHRTTPGRRSSIGRWREELDPPLLNACEEALREPLARLGYPSAAASA
jgi:hypothetical protein